MTHCSMPGCESITHSYRQDNWARVVVTVGGTTPLPSSGGGTYWICPDHEVPVPFKFSFKEKTDE